MTHRGLPIKIDNFEVFLVVGTDHVRSTGKFDNHIVYLGHQHGGGPLRDRVNENLGVGLGPQVGGCIESHRKGLTPTPRTTHHHFTSNLLHVVLPENPHQVLLQILSIYLRQAGSNERLVKLPLMSTPHIPKIVELLKGGPESTETLVPRGLNHTRIHREMVFMLSRYGRFLFAFLLKVQFALMKRQKPPMKR